MFFKVLSNFTHIIISFNVDILSYVLGKLRLFIKCQQLEGPWAQPQDIEKLLPLDLKSSFSISEEDVTFLGISSLEV